jgi:hypothetical protein
LVQVVQALQLLVLPQMAIQVFTEWLWLAVVAERLHLQHLLVQQVEQQLQTKQQTQLPHIRAHLRLVHKQLAMLLEQVLLEFHQVVLAGRLE